MRRLQAYLTDDVSRNPEMTKAARRDGTPFDVLRFFDAKKFPPILLLPQDPSGAATIELSGGPFAKATVENLGSGVKRDFDLRGAKTLGVRMERHSANGQAVAEWLASELARIDRVTPPDPGRARPAPRPPR